MIAKGKIRGEGGKLALYLMTGENGEAARVIDMRGLDEFGADAVQAFENMELWAQAKTRCKLPFFHEQIRIAPDERLSDAQWMEAVDRSEKRLGFTGQPRIVSFHINEATGDKHLHAAWFRVDFESERAIDPGMFKNHLKQLSRKLEREFAIRELSNDRPAERRARAADRKEFEESRRLKTDVNAIRTAILDCYQQSDSGKAFMAALESRGFELANGDRRDCFVVIDAAGGQHALNKKLTGLTLTQTRDKLADLDRSALPGVEQAQAMQAERHAQPAQEPPRQQAEPAPGMENQPADATGPYTELRAAQADRLAEPAAPVPERALTGTAAEIRLAWSMSRTASDLEDALAARGIALAQVTPEEAYASERRVALAKEAGRFAPAWRDGEIVAVDPRGGTYRLNERTTGDERPEIDGRLAGIDRAALMSVADTANAMRAASLEAWRSERQAERDQVRPPSAVEAAVAGILASTMTGTDFAARLDEKGLAITRATATDVQALEALRAADVSAGTTGDLASGRRFANLVEGDLAVVTRQGDVFRLSPHKLDAEEIEQRLADVQPRMPSVVEARAAFEIDRERKADQRSQNEADYIAARLDQADAFAGKQELRQTVHAAEGGVHTFFAASAAAIDNGLDAASGLFGGAAKIAGSLIAALGSFFGDSEPKMTRHQAEQQVKAATNEETLHAVDYGQSVQAKEAAYDEQIFRAAQEQQLPLAAPEYFRAITRPINPADRQRDDDRGRELERER